MSAKKDDTPSLRTENPYFRVDARICAEFHGVSVQQITNWIKEKGFPIQREKPKRLFYLPDTMRWRVEWEKQGRHAKTVDFNAARAELTARQAEKAALEVGALRETLVPTESVVAIVAQAATALREQLRSLASKLVVKFPDEMTPDLQAELTGLVQVALEEASDQKIDAQMRALLTQHYDTAIGE